MRKGVSTNTSRQYATGQRHYLNFCAQLNLPPCPASELSLLRFVASFGDRIRGSTVQNYLSAVRFLHVSNGYPNPLPDCERLKLVVRALKRISGPRRERIAEGIIPTQDKEADSVAHRNSNSVSDL
jgi:hypothetical protein